MKFNTNTMKRRLAAVVLGVATAAFVAPTAQAGDRIVDDWFRDAPHVATAQPSLSPTRANDHLTDDWFRDSIGVTASDPSGAGLGAREIGGVAASAAVLLLLGGLVLGRRQVRPTRHSIEGV